MRRGGVALDDAWIMDPTELEAGTDVALSLGGRTAASFPTEEFLALLASGFDGAAPDCPSNLLRRIAQVRVRARSVRFVRDCFELCSCL